ncbi:MAG: hypothetical protein ACJAWL_002542 [Motiliproteus sp.]
MLFFALSTWAYYNRQPVYDKPQIQIIPTKFQFIADWLFSDRLVGIGWSLVPVF